MDIKVFVCILFALAWNVSTDAEIKLVPIQKAWSGNSVNAVVFRHNSVTSHGKYQYAAFYDEAGFVVLAKRRLDSVDWQIRRTQYKGNITDAHNTICIMVDGAGFLHISWDHHNNSLHYCRSRGPGSLELSDMISMTGIKEDKVTYPEFYQLPDGNLIFLYRDGGSGNGNLMMNHYDVKTQTWSQLQDGVIDGEGERNAYWQMCIGPKGVIHLSWVWRETSDVASNHDMGYARSRDGGLTWEKSDGQLYTLPITQATAEYAARIPRQHELINTTSMSADESGNPYIVTYYREEGSDIPQYHLIYHDQGTWKTSQISQRKTPFSLSGSGSKRIPISRPQILIDSRAASTKAYMLFRDAERGHHVSLATCSHLGHAGWEYMDLTDASVGMWEPSYDTELWKEHKLLHIYVQNVGQGDGETLENIPSQTVSILECN